MSRRWIYAVVCIGSCLLPIINSAAGEVVLTAMKSHVKVGDPLFLRVTIHNKTDQAIAIYPALATEFYTILFGIRRAGVGEYQDVLAADQHPGTYGADNPEWIGPDKQRSAYAILFARDGKLVLDAPGNYELRVSVPYRKDEDRGRGLLTSEPIQVRVDPHSDEQMKLIHDSLPWLERVVGNFHVPNEPELSKQAGELRLRLDESVLKEALTWTITLIGLPHFDPADDRNLVDARLRAIRDKSDSITDEVIGIIMAHEYFQIKDWVSFKQTLRTLQPSSNLRLLEIQLRNHEREEDWKGLGK